MGLTTNTGRPGPLSEINVTPMADIMIVLLIIFMVMTPIIAGSVRLPVAAHARERDPGRLVVTVKLDRSLALEGSLAHDLGAVASEIRERLDALPEGGRVVYLKADADSSYADVARVIEMLQALGADQIGLMARPRAGA